MKPGLAQAYFLKDLNARELERIVAVSSEKRFAAGEVIVPIGSDVTSLYVVGSGRVRVVVPVETSGEGAAGEEVLVSIGPGECFGEFAFADRKPASAGIVAEEPTLAYVIPHVALDEIIEQDLGIARKVLRAMLVMVVERLRSTDAELVLARYIMRYV